MNFLIIKFTSLPRVIKGLIMAISDALIVIAVLLIAFYLRLGFFYWPEDNQLIVILC